MIFSLVVACCGYSFSLDWSGIEGNLFRVSLIDILVCLQSHYVVYSEIQNLIRIWKRFQATNKLFLMGNFKNNRMFHIDFLNDLDIPMY